MSRVICVCLPLVVTLAIALSLRAADPAATRPGNEAQPKDSARPAAEPQGSRGLVGTTTSGAPSPTTKPVPRLQIIPLPYDQASFTRDGSEIARYYFGKDLNRPFVFPMIGPSGRSLTRMGHPRDPITHSHHNSVWISHNDINGVSFWDDKGKGKIVHQRIDAYDDEGNDLAAITSTNHWIETATQKVLMVEHRRTAIELLEGGEWLMTIDLQLEPPAKADTPVTIGKTPFGIIGVRMAKTIGVNDGGGVIRNSEGHVNEKEIFWKPARWCDYSGPIAPGVTEGITLFDHPANPNHPTIFHVRSDGWMGASLTHTEPRLIQPGQSLRLRYGLFVHAGAAGGGYTAKAMGAVFPNGIAVVRKEEAETVRFLYDLRRTT